MQVRSKQFANIAISIAGAVLVILVWYGQWPEVVARSALATLGGALVGIAAYRLVVMRIAFRRVYPLGLVAVALLLQGLVRDETPILRIVSLALLAAGMLLYQRGRMRDQTSA